MNISAAKIAQILLLPLVVFFLSFIWVSIDIAGTPPFKQFSWSSLRDPSNWFVPVTFRAAEHQPAQELYPDIQLSPVSCLETQQLCWVAGDNGTLMHTKNGGKTWVRQASRSAATLNSVTFINDTHGWAAGHGILLHTEDGGKTWTPQLVDQNYTFTSISFINPNQGWVAETKGLFFTEDGGKTWARQTSATVNFISVNNGWITGSGASLLYVKDDEKNWPPGISDNDNFLVSMSVVNKNEAWAVSWNGRWSTVGWNETLFHTTTAGNTWTSQKINGAITTLSSVSFIDSNEGWTTNWNGKIFHTNDGGKNWAPQVTGTNKSLTSVNFVNANQGWASGYGILLHTEDGGKTWISQLSAKNNYAAAITFVNSTQGWIVGDGGAVLHSDDGGKTWIPQASNTTVSLYAVSFINSMEGWVVGNHGVVLHTNDGGKIWTLQESKTTSGLNSINFISPVEGWIVGDDGVILHTLDGGSTWVLQNSNTKGALNSVHFVDASHGWVAGRIGSLLYTNDGGKTWIQQGAINDDLSSVNFIDKNHGWAVGDYGTLLHTDNGGKVWTRQVSNAENYLTSVNFIDANLGWIVGQNGTVLHTEDGGKTWQPQVSATKSNLISVHFINAAQGWIITQNEILHTKDGGKTWINQSLHNKEFFKQLRDNRFGPYQQWPSPASAVVFLLSLLWLISRIRKLNETPSEFLSTENGGINDAPLDFADQDKLNYAPLAKGLAKLIRNIDTKPPLAIGLTAPWGIGKSSVLNMLRQDLNGDAKTVFFNAWHYRNDEQILAALIEHIRDQAVPSGISFENLLFRARLFWLRAIRPNWQWWFVALPVFVAIVSYLGDAQDFNRLLDIIKTKMDWLNEDVKSLLMFLPTSVWLFIGIVLLLKFRSSIFDFLLKPVASFSPALINELKTAGKEMMDATKTTDRNWDNDAGIRYQFQKDFNRICQALGQHKLVILIDDLDRCEYHYIEKIVGTLNFLFSNNSKCYVVMALDWDYVKTALGLAYKEMAKAVDEIKRETAKQSQHDHLSETKVREAFAEKYLRKIIQINVALPDRALANLLYEEIKPKTINSQKFPYLPLFVRLVNLCTCYVNLWFNKINEAASSNQHFNKHNQFTMGSLFVKMRPLKILSIPIKIILDLINILLINPFISRSKRHLRRDINQFGNILFISICFSILALVFVINIHLDELTKNNSTVQTSEVTSEAPAKQLQNDSATNISTEKKPAESAIVLERQKNNVVAYLFILEIILGGFLFLWIIWFVRQERDSSAFRLAMKDWHYLLESKIGSPREWRRLENNVRFFMMMSRSMDYMHPFDRLKDNLKSFKNKLIKWAEGEDWPVSIKEEFDEGVATRLLLANIYTQGKLAKELIYGGGGGLEALSELLRRDKPIDGVLSDFLNQYINKNVEHEKFIKKWLAIFAFKLQLPQIKEASDD